MTIYDPITAGDPAALRRQIEPQSLIPFGHFADDAFNFHPLACKGPEYPPHTFTSCSTESITAQG